MKKEIIIGVIGVAMIIAGSTYGIVSAVKDDVEMPVKTEEKVEVKPYDTIFNVRSRSSYDIYKAVDSRTDKYGVLELKIYNYNTDNYEWYSVYKFYNEEEIIDFITNNGEQLDFSQVDNYYED